MGQLRQHELVKHSQDLTSYQLWKVLNALLREAAAPLSIYGNMSIEAALSCLTITTNRRRKINSDDPPVLLTDLFVKLAEQLDNTEDRRLQLLDFLLSRGIERNILVDHITYALQTIRLATAPINRAKLVKHVVIQLENYETFKRDIIYRYYYLIAFNAKRNQKTKYYHGLKATPEDMLHVYIISAMRALDRFYPFEGTLTQNIKNWFQNAEGSSDFITYDNEALTLNRSVRKSVQEGARVLNNKAIPIEDRENTLPAEITEDGNEQFAEFSRKLALLPNACIVFLAQSLPYILSHAQKKQIEEHNAAMTA